MAKLHSNQSVSQRIRYVTCWEFKNKIHLEIDGGKIQEHRICLK